MRGGWEEEGYGIGMAGRCIFGITAIEGRLAEISWEPWRVWEVRTIAEVIQDKCFALCRRCMMYEEMSMIGMVVGCA